MRDLVRFLFRQRNNLLFLLLMAFSLFLVVNGNMHQRARYITSSNATIGQIHAWRQEVSDYASLGRVNQQLATAMARMRTEQYREPLAHRPDTAAMDTTGEVHFRFITAKVINSTTHKERNYITLDRGASAGIERDMGVVGMNGIVGIVRDVSPRFALVTSILSDEYRVAIQLKHTGHFGLLHWNTSDPYTVSMDDVAQHVPVQVGDTVVTRGNDGIFPPGFMVGTVEHVAVDPEGTFLDIRVHLGEDLTRTAWVHVVADLFKAERDSLEAQVEAME